ncbi:hypothetical protein M407DRAFT_229517 [Tulasnella calospora MUT 4182]|uniref:Uncharacterized protein n=1 Tax=Tulasnella calospora MUT 4182 TaxID=1051891 RepID=A0A0C3K6Q3_9AGAM|nr:hypothetical protein M407DRAFT_229517 [Tulasnella calospora MUT 4182]
MAPVTMNEGITPQANFASQHPDLRDVIKTITTNALLLQRRESAVNEDRSDTEELCSLVKQCLPAESHAFSLLPIAPRGRFMNLDRYLLVWCCMSVPGHPSLPSHISSKPVKTILQATADAGFGYSMRDLGRIEREHLMTRCKESAGSSLSELTDQRIHEMILEGIRAVFGRPAPQARFVPIMSPTSTTPEVAGSGNASFHVKNLSSEIDKDIEGREKRRNDDTEIETESTSGRQPGTNLKGPEQMLDAVSSVNEQKGDHSEISSEEVQLMMESLAISKTKKALFPAVKLVSPPPSHPTTSILRPVGTSNPHPEDAKEPEGFSPLEYTTNIGNAAVVHQIYLEARNTGVPRTPEQELARRDRACQMVLKEVKDVIQEVRWHRNGRGYQERPVPFVLEGIDRVPTEEKREWLLEKHAILKGRQRECRSTIWDNNEASDHLTVVVHALHVCKQAGEEGITF